MELLCSGSLELTSDNIVVFKNVSLDVGGQFLVRQLNFEINKGETLVFLGRSGSGKTTTLKLINRILQPTEGEIFVEGRTATAWDSIQLRRRIGYCIQETGLFPHFTVKRNVGVVPRLLGWPQKRIASRVTELLTLVGLDPETFRSRYPHELSGGQRQRVGVARALAADPPIILMDEPFGALDPITRNELQREFAALAKQLRKTIVFVTHDVREALFLAGRIGLFSGGRMIELLPPASFLRSQNQEVRAIVDSLQELPLQP